MPRSHHLRGIKVCAHCRTSYDGFKSMETRGRYCSPGCLADARAAHRARSSGGDDTIAFASRA